MRSLDTILSSATVKSAKAAIQKYWEIGRRMIDEGRSLDDMIK